MLRSERPTRATLRPAARAASATDSRRTTLLAKQVTATRPGSERISAASERRTSASEPECPSTMALVESQTSASSPSSPSFGQRLLVGARADQRVGIHFPVAGVQHGAGRGADDQRLRLGDGVRHADELQRERRQFEAAAGRHHPHRHFVQQLRLAQLAAQHGGGERGDVDRAAQRAPQIGHRPHMVLMRVGDDQADQLVAPVGDEARVGHHHVDLGMFGPAEADAAIHRQPCAAAAVEVEVHSDLAGPAQRQEGQIRVRTHHRSARSVSVPTMRAAFIHGQARGAPGRGLMWGPGSVPPTCVARPALDRDRYGRSPSYPRPAAGPARRCR